MRHFWASHAQLTQEWVLRVLSPGSRAHRRQGSGPLTRQSACACRDSGSEGEEFRWWQRRTHFQSRPQGHLCQWRERFLPQLCFVSFPRLVSTESQTSEVKGVNKWVWAPCRGTGDCHRQRAPHPDPLQQAGTPTPPVPRVRLAARSHPLPRGSSSADWHRFIWEVTRSPPKGGP